MLRDDAGNIAGAARRRAEPARGFTLLEVVVALAIAALALVGLFRAGSGGVLAVDVAGRVDEAIERAPSHLAEFGRVAALTPVHTAGDDRDGSRWRVRARPPGSPPRRPRSP